MIMLNDKRTHFRPTEL